jgi:aspartyl-tRNA(Asn)/glutamyl-tRNA(Gln) amidotransferase subunit B
VVEKGAPAKWASNWLMSELLRELNAEEKSADQCLVKPEQLAGLYRLIENGTISSKLAKSVFAEMYQTGKNAEQVVSEQ